MSEEQIPEKDKPFYLAVAGLVALLVTALVAAPLAAYLGLPAALDLIEKVALGLLDLDIMAWTFYFVKKNQGGK